MMAVFHTNIIKIVLKNMHMHVNFTFSFFSLSSSTCSHLLYFPLYEASSFQQSSMWNFHFQVFLAELSTVWLTCDILLSPPQEMETLVSRVASLPRRVAKLSLKSTPSSPSCVDVHVFVKETVHLVSIFRFVLAAPKN